MMAVRDEAPDLFAALESAGKVSSEAPCTSDSMPASESSPPPVLPQATVPRKTVAMSRRMVIGGPPTANPGVIDDLANLLESAQFSARRPGESHAGTGLDDQETNEVEHILDAEDLIDERETEEVDVVTDQDLSAIEEVLRTSSVTGLAQAVDAHRSVRSSSPTTSASASASTSFVDERVRRSFPWAWLTLTLMLGGGLVYILTTETDLFQGDLIARRQAEVRAEIAQAQAELERKAAEVRPEYGILQINSVPEGARVWLVKTGPTATFPNLPRDGEYHVVVFGDGFVPRTRAVKGTELDAPMILDLDPMPADDGPAELPDLGVPKVGSGNDVATLELRSNTPGAQLGLSLGWTPTVRVLDLDTSIPHSFLVDKSGHAPRMVTVGPETWQEGPDGDLINLQTVTLEARAPVMESEPAEDEVLEIVEDEPEAASARPKNAKKGRRKTQRKSR